MFYWVGLSPESCQKGVLCFTRLVCYPNHIKKRFYVLLGWYVTRIMSKSGFMFYWVGMSPESCKKRFFVLLGWYVTRIMSKSGFMFYSYTKFFWVHLHFSYMTENSLMLRLVDSINKWMGPHGQHQRLTIPHKSVVDARPVSRCLFMGDELQSQHFCFHFFSPCIFKRLYTSGIDCFQ